MPWHDPTFALFGNVVTRHGVSVLSNHLHNFHLLIEVLTGKRFTFVSGNDVS